MNDFSIFSINGKIVDKKQAILPIDSIEVQYGFGVYENIKVRNKIAYFVYEHINRLTHSGKCIGLEHNFSKEKIFDYIEEYKKRINIDSCNLKLLLLGGRLPVESQLVIMASAPFYPKRDWYRDGITLKSYIHERYMPQAKTLNMLPSYIIYKDAKSLGHYDALLIDNHENVLEGTRTNVFFINDKNIYHPPISKILEGVTMISLKKVLLKHSFKFIEREIPLNAIHKYEGMFLSSTSSKILPVRQVDNMKFENIAKSIIELSHLYDEALEKCRGDFKLL